MFPVILASRIALTSLSLSQGSEQAPALYQSNRRETPQRVSCHPPFPQIACLLCGQVSERRGHLWRWQSLRDAQRAVW